ncbi:MAG: hypothetical protein C5B52_13815 [Bacteroidetes bacterium]|nr:MAG: hypothetical protein C5B52_13815 [Bacteroidota bacterium]
MGLPEFKISKMKKYLSIFNYHTILILALSFLSVYICIRYDLSIYVDFLILGIIIVFPLTFSMRVAFRRRERALQYLSLYKASLQSILYVLNSTKLDDAKKEKIKSIARKTTDELCEYLMRNADDAGAIERSSHEIYTFIRSNKDAVKSRVSLKLLLFLTKMNESIEFLLATRRHSVPWGPSALVLLAIYTFTIFYPASLIHKTGLTKEFWYIFTMTAGKAIFLITFYNIQHQMRDPFNQKSPDGIRVNDFRLADLPEPIIIETKRKNESGDEDDYSENE